MTYIEFECDISILEREAKLKEFFELIEKKMCIISESNRYILRCCALNAVCLPFPPIMHIFEQIVGFEPTKNRFAVCLVKPLPYTCVFYCWIMWIVPTNKVDTGSLAED